MEMEGEVVKLRFKSVCVFCGSRTGKRKCYTDVAVELAQQLVARSLDLVYGGWSIILMGIVSKTVHRAGGNVIGIIPSTLMRKETHITGETVREVRPIGNRNQRKEAMANHSDCFIALPSGYRTLEELLEVITWVQLGIHDKPIRNNNMVIVELVRRLICRSTNSID
ncbi:cytokinin riboside 5'-monophosphate phosphoribohydrolase LOG5-like [Gossypium arboreum]|uniref:cytokinin riboside 5'-monophosphate phosphoribohydrolase LOG5-like n=1 Tax=Gossypium arboreum TaxID=29729 RepID=UPI0022F19CE3|nr:cytokinin riboside 5'-monophosphate phosphoribohydrolase LOG5-like [Gossypium arboreum]